MSTFGFVQWLFLATFLLVIGIALFMLARNKRAKQTHEHSSMSSGTVARMEEAEKQRVER